MVKLLKFGLIGLSTFLGIMILTVPNHSLSYEESWLVAGVFFSITAVIVFDLIQNRLLDLKEDREHYEKRVKDAEEKLHTLNNQKTAFSNDDFDEPDYEWMNDVMRGR